VITAGLSMLRLVPVWAYAIALALAWGGFQHHRATAAVNELAEVRESAYRAALIETTRRLTAQQEVTHAADLALASARADADAAALAAGRLRNAARNAASRACSATPASPGAAASAPAVVLADVLSSADARAGELAAAVDAARVAGIACERAYEALRP